MLMNEAEHLFAVFNHPAEYLLNHSCDPNIKIHFDHQKRMIWSVLLPIPAGGQIFRSYGPTYSLNIKNNCDFKESCVPCQEGWGVVFDTNRFHGECRKSIREFFEINDPQKLESLLKHKAEICDFINNNFEGYNADPEKRQLIVTMTQQLKINLNVMGIPFPLFNPFFCEVLNKDPEEEKKTWNIMRK